jgi:hypothetical protein
MTSRLARGERARRAAQGDVQHRAALAGVDLLTAEHAFGPLLELRLAGQRGQQRQARRIDALLREVVEDAVEA